VKDVSRKAIVADLLRVRDDYVEHWKGMQARAARISDAYKTNDALAASINQTFTGSLQGATANVTGLTDAASREHLAAAAIDFAAADAQFLRFRASENQQALAASLAGLTGVARQLTALAAQDAAAKVVVQKLLSDLGKLQTAVADSGQRAADRTQYLKDFTTNGTALTDGAHRLQQSATGAASASRTALISSAAAALYTLLQSPLPSWRSPGPLAL
jgi:hypothetical protein